MKIVIQGAECSMGCMYAETDACKCKCGRASHGILVPKKEYVQIKCSPAAEKRCKEGHGKMEDCVCACAGTNHGIYQHIENFESIKINHYV